MNLPLFSLQDQIAIVTGAAKFPYPYLSIIYQTSGACR